MENTIKIVQEYYDSDAEKEWSRIADRPEFLLTCRMLDRYIKPGDKVLDIGGGPGRYSFYLADKGCDVTLFDLSSENIKFAQRQAVEQNLSIKTIVGDAREADKLSTEQYDHVLLMGPMYHLLEECDRVASVNAALKLLKSGGIVYISFINLFAGIVFYMKDEPDYRIDPDYSEYIRSVVEGKSYGGDAFTKAFFIDQREVLPFMRQFPLEKLHLFGQEGVTSPHERHIMAQSQEVIDLWLDFSEKVWEREEFFSYSEHLMYVGRKNTDELPCASPEDEEVQREIAYYNTSPCEFEDFIELPDLTDGEIRLVCVKKVPGDPIKKWVPGYNFAICKGSEKVGGINLRIGYTNGLYYGGQIGYGVDEKYRGFGYAGKACQLLMPVAKAHGMSRLLITTNYTNEASKRVCEKLGARLVRVARLPEWHDLYKEGQRYQNIFEWTID